MFGKVSVLFLALKTFGNTGAVFSIFGNGKVVFGKGSVMFLALKPFGKKGVTFLFFGKGKATQLLIFHGKITMIFGKRKLPITLAKEDA